jgi:hypothetical protein
MFFQHRLVSFNDYSGRMLQIYVFSLAAKCQPIKNTFISGRERLTLPELPKSTFMKKLFTYSMLLTLFALGACTSNEKAPASAISQKAITATIDTLTTRYGDAHRDRIEKGISQAAALWRTTDGTEKDFMKLCIENYAGNDSLRLQLFNKLSYGFEMLNGYFLLLNKELLRPLQLDWGPVTPIDELFGGFNAAAHLTEDLFANKIAFITVINFPNYSLKEKTEKGASWSRLEWAYARMGDMFTSRIPAELIQNFTTANTAADTYISQYNIYLGNLENDKGERLFPKDLKLISHWGLRDEIKARYADGLQGLERQQMIYQVMKRIIDQSIPVEVINKDEYTWNPYSNQLKNNGETVAGTAEPDVRYQHVINQFKALKAMDPYSPNLPTFIQRKFEGEFEVPVEEVENLFTTLLSSPEVKETAQLISRRLGRPLEPFDIWYDGFKARSSIPSEKLDAITTRRFANAEAFAREIPSILTSLGWSKEKAEFIASRIQVENSRGAGHAWGGEMRKDNALLRTRIPAGGMNYKGFNIAMHEFGHTVEQTISLHDVDYYTLHGVPNTAFTEALAFVFQKRDLDVLGMKETNPEKEYLQTLDNLWSCYEIMGVSMVDIRLWKWLYEHPDATPVQVKEAVISIAKDVWNQFFAESFGKKDEPILAIYSHMIDNPLYLSAYPMGHLIEFQLEKQLKGKDFAAEIQRIFSQGRLIPDLWLKNATGEGLSVKPLLESSREALNYFQNK